MVHTVVIVVVLVQVVLASQYQYIVVRLSNIGNDDIDLVCGILTCGCTTVSSATINKAVSSL